MPLGVAIIGCGKVGQKRSRALAGATLVACADTDIERAEALAKAFPESFFTANFCFGRRFKYSPVNFIFTFAGRNLLCCH